MRKANPANTLATKAVSGSSEMWPPIDSITAVAEVAAMKITTYRYLYRFCLEDSSLFC
jgi:hypothetical protein